MGASLRVLVADDEPKIRRLLQQILEGKGCQVCLAEDGLEALTQFQAQPCDVVITDIRMPKVTGLELLVELKRLDPLVHVVVITAYPSVEGAVEAMKIGACDFITKPFDLAQIQAILYRAQQRLSLSKQLRSTGEGVLKLEELNRRLGELNDLKSRFLATLSRGINTPLGLMGEWLYLLSDGTLGTLSADQQRAIEILLRAYERLKRLLEQLIDLMHGPTMALRRDSVSVQELVHQAVEVVEPRAAARAITVTVRVPEEPLPLEVDQGRCRAAVEYVLDNAIKFNHDGGTVTLDANETGEAVQIRITDSGIGIPTGEHEKVFAPFYQVDRRLPRMHEGAGIGLTLAKRYAELHGGSLQLTSEVGTGTSVLLTIPRRAPPLPLPPDGDGSA